MMRWNRRLIIAGIAVLAMTAVGVPGALPGRTDPAAGIRLASGAEGKLLPVAEVRAGMRGTGKTVVRGTKVETFDVEVLSVLRGGGPAGDLVLVRVSGPVIQQTGGIAAGMSGSPVYIQGRLLGAIGYGWSFSDHTLGLVTPIQDMVRALPGSTGRAGPTGYTLPAPLQVSGRTVRRVVVARTAGTVGHEPRDALVFAPVAVPLLVTGMGPRSADAVAHLLRPYGIIPVEGGAGSRQDLRTALAPGSAIGVQLARGDVNLTAVGTVTYRDGPRLLAFGHAFLNRGEVEYLLTPAEIHQVVRSVATPFKVGTAGAVMGIIREDRRAGIGGTVGGPARTFAIRVRVRDADRGTEAEVGLRVVPDPELAPGLTLIGVVEAFDRALGRVGGGTARLRMAARGVGLPATIERRNAYYHSRDVAVGALNELPEALRLLFSNEFVKVEPVDLIIEAEVGRTRHTAALVEVLPAKTRVRPGETLLLDVQLRPFHGEPVTRHLEITIPDDFPTGQATLIVRGGVQTAAEQGLMNLLQMEGADSSARTLTEQLAGFVDRDQNTQVVVELLPARAGTDRTTVRPRVREATPWVVRGRQQLTVTVER